MMESIKRFFRKKKPIQESQKQIQRPKKQGCKFRYKKKSDGYEITFSPECKQEERAEIMRQFKERQENDNS